MGKFCDARTSDPPPYRDVDSVLWQADPPPAYGFPTDFTIGSRTTLGSLVKLDDIKVHLNLLDSIHDLRLLVEEGKDDRLPHHVQYLDEERRWSWFVSLAVERFERWIREVEYVDHNSWFAGQVPPLDVWMVWHSYLLNPNWFAEDCRRVPDLHQLRFLNEVFNITLRKVYDGKISLLEPSELQETSFLKMTDTPFRPFDAMRKLDSKVVECPQCQSRSAAQFLTMMRTGYAQENFKIQCKDCGFEITKETLAVAKFVKNLFQPSTNCGVTVPAGFIAGTFHTPQNGCDAKRAQDLKSTIYNSHDFALYETEDESRPEKRLQEALEYSMASVRKGLRSVITNEQLIDRILSAYEDDRHFSIDLVGTVLRQGSFIKKMYDFGWTGRKYLNDARCEVVLQHSIARYHAFLDLMALNPGWFCVPTLDIDLVWHTHQLMHNQYEYDCRRYLGRNVDHYDKVEANALSTAFDATAHAWEAHFGVPYTLSPLEKKAIGKRLSLDNDSSTAFPYLRTPSSTNFREGTYPSEHNAISRASGKRPAQSTYPSDHHPSDHHPSEHNPSSKTPEKKSARSIWNSKGKEKDSDRNANDSTLLMPIPMHCDPGSSSGWKFDYGGTSDGGVHDRGAVTGYGGISGRGDTSGTGSGDRGVGSRGGYGGTAGSSSGRGGGSHRDC